MSSGALGRGSYRSVVAGTRPNNLPTYYPCVLELIELHKAHQEVLRLFYVRDRIFDNKFPGCSLANGLYKLVPNKRESFHSKEIMESIRRRTIWMQRIRQQRALNANILDRASKTLSSDEMKARFSYKTADADAYFNPLNYTGANNWPNYWQHPTMAHVIPKPRWARVPELGGITRVQDSISVPSVDY
ncbi:unnamed protein product [Phytomonas sp. Hart1]|nr:unnamed protein product [Phytomonas sp. Hart1]|eukprot:CCW71155.1 unnamed protein product [Phytomonas sp. isolate Hart1]